MREVIFTFARLPWTIASLGALALSLLAVAGPAQAATSYTFTVMADSSALHLDASSFGCPAINDNDDVVVRAETTGGSDRIFEVLADGGIVNIAHEGSQFSFLGRNPSINDSQQVSFAANLPNGAKAILRGDATGLTNIPDKGANFRFFGFETSVNDAGRVAFKAELRNNDQGLFSGTGGALDTTYLASKTKVAGDQSRTSINDRGEIAFLEELDGGGSGVFRVDGRRFTTIADDSGPIAFATIPSLNDQGAAAFLAFLTAGGEAVMVGNGTLLRTVADTDGPYQTFDGDPSLNDVGGVVLTAGLDNGKEGVFTGRKPRPPPRWSRQAIRSVGPRWSTPSSARKA
jgi:hypothetical protein